MLLLIVFFLCAFLCDSEQHSELLIVYSQDESDVFVCHAFADAA